MNQGVTRAVLRCSEALIIFLGSFQSFFHIFVNVGPSGDNSFRNMYIFQPSGRTEAQKVLVATSDFHVIFCSCRGVMKKIAKTTPCYLCSSLICAMDNMEAAVTHI